MQEVMSWGSVKDKMLSEANAEDPPGDYLYFKTEYDRLMFVLRWA